MPRIQIFLLTILIGLTPAAATTHPPAGHEEIKADSKAGFAGTITIGTTTVGPDGNIRVGTLTSQLVAPLDSAAIMPDGPTDLYIDPRLLNGPGQPVFGNEDRLFPFGPGYGPGSDAVTFLNNMGLFFSTASGGFGFRINYDRKLSPQLRFIASPEFLTYGLLKAASILGDQMPEGTTRVTLISIPIGLQRQFASKSRLNPHIGFGVGPMMRLDHRSPRPGYYPYNSLGIDNTFGNGRNSLGLSVPLYLDDFPRTSLTLGGHVASGLNIRLGAKKDLALTLEGRYTLARFVDELGSPGNFSGLSLAIGFGKAF